MQHASAGDLAHVEAQRVEHQARVAMEEDAALSRSGIDQNDGPAALAALHPAQPREIHTRRSQRLQGRLCGPIVAHTSHEADAQPQPGTAQERRCDLPARLLAAHLQGTLFSPGHDQGLVAGCGLAAAGARDEAAQVEGDLAQPHHVEGPPGRQGAERLAAGRRPLGHASALRGWPGWPLWPRSFRADGRLSREPCRREDFA